MNQEILSRGKRIDTGDWEYGYFVKDPSGRCRIYYQPFEEATSNTYHFVIPETVGRFTGLAQSNNHPMFDDRTKLWEDDVFTLYGSITKYKTVFDNFEWVGISCDGDSYGPYRIRISAAKKTSIIIIGNTHDNPKIMEGGQQ